MKRVSVLVASSVLFAFSGSSVEAAQVASRNGCVNLRSQPSINAGVIRCLPPGTNLEPYRSPASGRFTWHKEGDRVWYYTSVSGTSEKGWILRSCTDIFDVDKSTCTDTGSAAPLAKPQQPQAIAQSEQKEEVLQNTNWQVVPGAKVGHSNPADTLLNVNGISRANDLVTFDVTGYKGFYNRLQGDCGSRQVSIIRRGLQTSANDIRNRALRVRYQPVAGEDSNRVTPWHQTILDFACRQPGTQIASSPAGASTQAVGTVQCRGIMRGSPVDSNPIQKATLEPSAGGYIFRFTEVVQGQPRERVWNLSNLLIVKNVRSYDPDQSITPIKIQSGGAFSKAIMPSSREECTFSGTLQFIGNTQAQLFPGSSVQATNSAQTKPSTAKIAEGVYWVGATGMGLRVRGGQYQRYEEGGESPWKPIAELTAIKDGVLKAGDDYWCLSTLPKPQNSRSSICSANGWTTSPSVTSKPGLSVSPMKPSTSITPSTSTSAQTQSAPTTAPSSSGNQSSSPSQPPSAETPVPTQSPPPSPPATPEKPSPKQPQSDPNNQPPSSYCSLPENASSERCARAETPQQPSDPFRSLRRPGRWLGGAAGDGGNYFPDAMSACQSIYKARKVEGVKPKYDDINRFVAGVCDVEGLAPENGEQVQVFCDPGYFYKGEIQGACISQSLAEPVSPNVKPAVWEKFIVTLGDLQFATGIGLCNLSSRAFSRAKAACAALEDVYEALRPDVDYGCQKCVPIVNALTDVLGKKRSHQGKPENANARGIKPEEGTTTSRESNSPSSAKPGSSPNKPSNSTDEPPNPSLRNVPEGIDIQKSSQISLEQQRHILDGDKSGGGHRFGTGIPDKSEFPSRWSDQKIMDYVSDIVKDPNSRWIRQPGRKDKPIRYQVKGTRDGIDVTVVVEPNGKGVVTAFPTNTPKNPKNLP